jgi:hypothetical protein
MIACDPLADRSMYEKNGGAACGMKKGKFRERLSNKNLISFQIAKILTMREDWEMSIV